MFCANCGSQIDDGAKFCMSCGNAINNAPVSQAPAPQQVAQAVQSNENNGIMKQGFLSHRVNLLKAIKGVAMLYNNRFEWKSEKEASIVIHISEILSVEVSKMNETLTINLTNSKKYVFSKTLTSGEIAQRVAFGALGARGSIIAELAGWQSAIDMVRGHS